MDSVTFDELGARLFGGRWGRETEKPRITGEERRLLDLLQTMPPGLPSNPPTKKKIRPSSASANLQSHPCYRTSLYDDRATAAGVPCKSNIQ